MDRINSTSPAVDSDDLTTHFDHISAYVRFTHCIIYNNGGLCVVVPLMYARNIPGLIVHAEVQSADKFPQFPQAAVNGELLSIEHKDAEKICSLITSREAEPEKIYNELICLNSLKVDKQSWYSDHGYVSRLTQRLISHFSAVNLGGYSGSSIMWIPENYMCEGDDSGDSDSEDHDLESQIRREICRQIISRPVPMVNLIPIDETTGTIMTYLLKELHFHDWKEICNTYYVQILKKFGKVEHRCLRTLMADEFRCVKNELPITNTSCFIFGESDIENMKCTVSPDKARENLKYYVGSYLDDLDLTKSYITGSAIAASLTASCTKEHRRLSINEVIDVFYPAVTTTMEPSDLANIRHPNPFNWTFKAISENKGVATSKTGEEISFDIKPGADVDIAVDSSVSDDEYREIAMSHFSAIKKSYPCAKIREYIKPKGDWNYLIYTDDPDHVQSFRCVDIYRSTFRNICSHHVGAVRGCYTSIWDNNPHFYVTASAMWTSIHNETPNYHYFAGRKSNPQDIIIKYIQRGIGVADEAMNNIIKDYIKEKGIILSKRPALRGKGVPYSIFSAHREMHFVNEI